MEQLIGMVAGESSGDLLGSHLVRALHSRDASLRFSGIGGPKMEAEGFVTRYPMEKLAVRGYVEVLRHYRGIMAIRRELRDWLLQAPPALFIGIDAPDFNLGLEQQLKQSGVRTVHYVSPSVWAWRGGRVAKIVRSADHLLALFPFEPELYRDAGLPVTYVGHPLADMIPLERDTAAARERLKLPEHAKVVALLPGSRKSEIEYLGAAFIRTAALLAARMPGLRFVCPTATRATRDMLETLIHRTVGLEFPITLLFGHSQDALAAADAALVASGTATLEAALHKTPMVIAYRMSPITWALMRRMLYLPWVGLPNVLAGRALVPEFLQEAATPERMATSLEQLLTDASSREAQVLEFRRMHETLRQNTAEKAAEVILGLLGGRGA